MGVPGCVQGGEQNNTRRFKLHTRALNSAEPTASYCPDLFTCWYSMRQVIERERSDKSNQAGLS
jgi:hypothetical protein